MHQWSILPNPIHPIFIPSSEWPEAIGRVSKKGEGRYARSAVELFDTAKATEEFFLQLDSYLKSNKVKFSDLFRRYDTSGEGKLSPRELRELIRDIMPSKVTDAQVRLFVILMDENEDQEVTEREFLDAARECLKLSKSTTMEAAVGAVLHAVSSYLYKNTSDAASVWESLDKEDSGYLTYERVAAFFRKLPGSTLGHAELKHLITCIHSADVDHKGKVSFQEMLCSLRAVDLKTSQGSHVRGFKHSLQRPGAQRRQKEAPDVDDFSPWVMVSQAVSVKRGESSYLLDKESGMLFSQPKVASEYPSPAGHVEDEQAVLYTKEQMDASQFFKVLDSYLKKNKVNRLSMQGL